MTRIAYLTSRYPAVSHTFIRQEVLELRRCGQDVKTFSIRRVTPDELLTDIDRQEQSRTEFVLPTSPARLVWAQVKAFTHAPWRYCSTLAWSQFYRPPGWRAAVWRVFYFVEAGIFAAQLRKHGVTHVHAHFANVAADVAMLAARLIGGTWSMTLHGESDFSNPVNSHLSAKIKDATFVACVSEFGRAQAMLRSDPNAWNKIHVVRTGVDLRQFTPLEAEAPPDRTRPFRLLTVGRLSPEKGHVFLLQALGQLRQADREFHLTIIGDGPLRRALEAECERQRCTDRVSFLGAVGQDRLRDCYRAADVFVLPSLSEGLPVVLMEAMACALPVVASRIAGIPELVQDGLDGKLVVPGNPDAIASALRALASDAAALREMGRHARRKVCEYFDHRTWAKKLAAVFVSSIQPATAGENRSVRTVDMETVRT
jgi:glycosyltransferase involved in cell wall biosynthesis